MTEEELKKEAEEYANRFWGKKESLDRACSIDNFKDGAEFGYNKCKKELAEAGEIIKDMLRDIPNRMWYTDDVIKRAEAFIKE